MSAPIAGKKEHWKKDYPKLANIKRSMAQLQMLHTKIKILVLL